MAEKMIKKCPHCLKEFLVRTDVAGQREWGNHLNSCGSGTAHEKAAPEDRKETDEVVQVAKGKWIRHHRNGALITLAVGRTMSERIQKSLDFALKEEKNPEGPNAVLCGWLDWAITEWAERRASKVPDTVLSNPRKKAKNKKRVYRTLAQMLAALESGSAHIAKTYFTGKIQYTKWKNWCSIGDALEKGDLNPAIEYCKKKMAILEAVFEGKAPTASFTVVQVWKAEKERLDKRLSVLEALVKAIEAGDSGTVKTYMHSRLEETKRHSKVIEGRLSKMRT